MTDKATFRRRFLNVRKALSPADRTAWSQRIQDRVVESSTFQKAPCIALYLPIQREVDTEAILREAWKQKKTVGLPRWQPQECIITFYQVQESDSLITTAWGTCEPPPISESELILQNIDLMLIPGIVFDTHGFRLGYGQGGYDRVLARYSGPVWGLAYESQLVDSLPHEPHDMPCSRIITEKRQIEVQ